MAKEHDTKNPCVKVCKFSASGDRGVCLACFRTRSEVRGWKRLSDAEKSAINQRIHPLMAGQDAPFAARKLRKVEKRIAKLEKRLKALEKKRNALLTAEPIPTN
jgi:predicted Fe-S protein YdhL (DUF1289 family)